ncbi:MULTISPECIES: putative phage abortive infection protein [Sphingobacterium]|uniref:Phage abortive infection protein n=1 Tax=Sphingobacterium populi TaxID=1812824 RepID=A0ABW5UE46_9SPHI|nr:putative phage abortive infection protein [Sphingobacterium sp. CFCC 11742]
MANKTPNLLGRATFSFILDQIRTCVNELAIFIEECSIEELYDKNYLEKSKKVKSVRDNIDLKNWALCDIAYAIVFFGVSENGIKTITGIFRHTYKSRFLEIILTYFAVKPHKDSEYFLEWKMADQEFKDYYESKLSAVKDFFYSYNDFYPTFFKFYGGHQAKLGHYYRHLYQTVTYINQQEIFTYKEKYEYTKTLRAQLSTPEQYILFFNSISMLGRVWEFDKIDATASQSNSYLITKYNLIKNIPDLNFARSINIDDFYPDVKFEFRDKSPLRTKMEKFFK